MGTRLRRFVLGGLLLVVLLYTGGTLLLNSPIVKQHLLDETAPALRENLTVGFVYLRWNLQPTIRWVRYSSPAAPPDSTFTAMATGVSFHLRYGSLMNGLLGRDPGSILRRIQVDSLAVTARPDWLRRWDETGFPEVPRVPVDLGTWELEVRSPRFSPLRLGGPSGSYRVGSRVHLRAHRLAGKDVRMDVSVPIDRALEVRVDARKLSLPDRIWELSGDEWSGRILFQPRRGRGIVTARLEGSPGRVQNLSLPPVELRSRLVYGDTRTRVQTLSVMSDYFRSVWTGSIDHDRGALNVRGSLDLRIADLFNRVVATPPFDRVSIVDELPLVGTFELGGTLSEPSFNGGLTLPGTTLQLSFPGFTERLVLSRWEGRYEAGKISFRAGRAQSGDRQFNLRKGYITISSGDIVTSVTGVVRRSDTETPGPLLKPLADVLGDLQSLELPVNLSFILGPDSIETALGVDGGRVDFQSGSFRDITLLSSTSSKEPGRATLSGRFEGPDENSFEVSGNPTGTLRLTGEVKRLDRWLHAVLPGAWSPPEMLMEGLQLTGTLEPGARESYRFDLRADTGRVQLGTVTRPVWSLSARAHADSGQLHLEELRLADPGGSLTVNGGVRYRREGTRGEWDLRVRGQEFDYSFLVAELYGADLPANGRADLEARVSGPLENPRYRGTLRDGFLELGHLRLRPLRLDGSGTGADFNLTDLRGTLAGGRVTGRVRRRPDPGLSVDLDLANVRAPGLFPGESWWRENVDGHLDGGLVLRHLTRPVKQWQGRVSVAGSDFVIQSMPRVEKLEQIASSSFLDGPHPLEPFRFEFPVEDGVVRVRDFKLISRDVELDGSGTVDLRGPVDARLNLVLRQRALRRNVQDLLGDFYRRIGLSEEKELTLPLRVGGTLMSPKLEVDESAVNKNYRRNLIESIFSEELGHPLNEILDEIPFFD